MRRALSDHVALVAGGTRGAGRAIAAELGSAGATVYVTGRSSRAGPSEMGRPETIEDAAEVVTSRGGRGIAVRVDHSDPAQVAQLVARIDREQSGRLDILINDIWGGDPLTEWDTPFWRHDLSSGLRILTNGVHTHLITSWHAVPLMVRAGRGLVVEMTDGISADYRGSLFYDLAKASVIRAALGQAGDLREHGVTVLALTPGFLRSEAVLDHFGVTEANWRDGVAKDPHFAASETPYFVGRAVVALATDPAVFARTGQALSSWDLAKEYGFTDVDGTRPDWGDYFAEVVKPTMNASD
jgi:NAD(P)-dependent dehydrogenase (short-subunit alcohol dehydrogenase family)